MLWFQVFAQLLLFDEDWSCQARILSDRRGRGLSQPCFAAALLSAGHECVLYTLVDWPQGAWPETRRVSLPGCLPRLFADALERTRAAVTGSRQCDYLFSLERVWRCDCYRAGDGVHRAWLERRKEFEPFWKPLSRSLFNRKHRQLLALEEQLFGAQTTGAVIANSHMIKAEIIRHYGYPAERIHVVPNGLPPLRRRPSVARADPGPAGNPGFRIRRAVRRAAAGNARGSGLPLRECAAPISQMRSCWWPGGKSARLPAFRSGPVSGAGIEMEAHYAAADAFILPTLYDPFSNACLEALSAGLPVITTAANGFAEVLQPGIDGEVIEDPRDAEAVAGAIERWSDPERRTAIKPHLAALTARFTIDANVSATLAVIQP